MANVSAHGGGCCGMRHLHTFRDDAATNTQELIRRTTQDGLGDGRFNLEVILSNLQTQENPELLAELARLGYVYTTSWTGQHGTPVHLFHRTKTRLALNAAHFYRRWTQELDGMVAGPGLEGTLPHLEENVQQGVVRGGGFLANLQRRFPMGSRFRVHSPQSRFHNQEAQVVGHINRGRYENVSGGVRLRNAQGEQFKIVPSNLVLIGPAPEEDQRDPVVYRHQNNNRAEPAARQERRLILSQFYCVFRNNGNESRVFESLQAGQEAYPRATRWMERRVYSDGQIEEGPVRHG